MDLKFRDSLPPDVAQELDQFVTRLQQFLYAEHTTDGQHSAIRPSSLTLQGAQVGVFTDLPYDATRFVAIDGGSTWTVDSIDVAHLRFTRIGQLVIVQFRLRDTAVGGASTSGLRIQLPELHMLPQQDQDGLNIQMAGVVEIEDSDGTTHGDITVSAITGGVAPATYLILQKFHQTAAGGTEPRNIQTGNVAVQGIASFMVTASNAAQAFN